MKKRNIQSINILYFIPSKDEHILMDCTYAYQPGFTQTMIIMYYDIIVFKFIPEKISEGEKG